MPVYTEKFFNFVRNNLQPLVRKYGDPFVILHGPEIRGRIRRINSAFHAYGLDFTELYALKANPRFELFKQFMMPEGVGADCSSGPEMCFVKEVELPGHRTMLTANNAPSALYQTAIDFGAHLNLDDLTYIPKVPDPMPSCMSLRLNLGAGSVLLPGEEGGKIDFNRSGSKFGIAREDMPIGYGMLRDRGVSKYGIHSMMVSNELDYRKAAFIVEQEFEVLSEAVSKFGVEGSYVNIGGGLGIPYLPGQPEYDVEALAHEVARIAENFRKKHGNVPKIFMESGRFVTGPSGILVNKIENIFTKFGHKFLGVQIAMQAMPRPMLYPGETHHHHVIVEPDGSLCDGPLEKVSIVGASCEDTDRLETDIMLPQAKEGYYVFSFSAGAHCVDQGSDYNWQVKPPELMVGDFNNVQQICGPRDYADLTARQRGLNVPEHVLHLG